MYAIVEIAGQQFKVEKGKSIFVHRLANEEGAEVTFDNVLLIDNEGKISIGAPLVEGAFVEGKVLSHVKGDKVIVFKKKRRKGYQKSNGHRQLFSSVEILAVNESGKPKAAKAVVKEAPAEEKPEAKVAEAKKPATDVKTEAKVTEAKVAEAKKPVTEVKAEAKVAEAKKPAAKTTAAKKPVSTPATSGTKKPTVKPESSTTAPVKPQAVVKAKPAAAKAAPPPGKPKTAAPSKASAKPVAAKSAAVQIETEEPKTMKTTDTKSPVAKSPAVKAAPAKSAPTKTTKTSKKAATIPQTDAELMAMPESDYMNAAQLAYFKAKLTTMRDEMLENARETGEHLKENEVFADPNDRATVEEENLLEQRVRDRERKLLKKINASLVRIESGEYGYCQDTGDSIGLPRLLAWPTAELSIEAQEKHERLEKLYAD